LVEPKRERRVAAAVGQRREQPVGPTQDRVEARPQTPLAEGEVMCRRGRPDVADAVVRARDPDALTGRDRLAFRGRRQALAALWTDGRRLRLRRESRRRAEV